MFFKRNKLTAAVMILLLLITAAVVFLPALRNGFTNWDDREYVVDNKDLRDGSLPGLWRVATSFYNANFHPLTMLVYWLGYRFYGLDPAGYHLISFLLHLINIILVFWFCRKLSASTLTAFIAASLFALHPMQVEAVAWISDLKGLLCALFFLAGLIAYLFYLQKGKKIYYWVVLSSFIFSLLSKVMAVTFPLTLLLLDYHNKRRIDKAAFLEKIPFFELSLVFVIVGTAAQAVFKTIIPQSLPLVSRLLIPFYAVYLYIEKTIIPLGLTNLYPFPFINETLSIKYFAAALQVLGLVVLGIFSIRYSRKVIFGMLFFLFLILPVLKVVPFGNWIIADRHAYLAHVGLFYLCGEALRRTCSGSRAVKIRRACAIVFLMVIIAALCFLSRQRIPVWRDSISLWSDAIAKYPHYPVAYSNRASAYIEEGRPDEAIADCTRAIEITPEYAQAYFNRHAAYLAKGNVNQAQNDINRFRQLSGID